MIIINFIENAIGFFSREFRPNPITTRNRLIWLDELLKLKGNREEKLLLHVAMVAKFLNLNKLFPSNMAEKLDIHDFPVL